jgi:hypothetical protein
VVTAVAMLALVMHVTQSELRMQVVTLKPDHTVWKVVPQAVYIAFLMQSESAFALVHMLPHPAAFTLNTFQLAMFWLKADAK